MVRQEHTELDRLTASSRVFSLLLCHVKLNASKKVSSFIHPKNSNMRVCTIHVRRCLILTTKVLKYKDIGANFCSRYINHFAREKW